MAPEGGLTVYSVVLLNQIRSIDKLRLLKRLGSLKQGTMARVNRALMVSVAVVKI